MTAPYYVLIVDDDQMMRLLSRQAMMTSGFEVSEVEDGLQALASIKQRKPDLVLLDVTMPNLDGFAVCRELRKDDDTQRIPVIMLTGLDDVQSISSAYEAGATDFIIKPINWHILIQRVQQVLRASETFSALRTSQARLEHAQRIAHLGNWEWDIDSDIIHGSDEACRILGIEPGTDLTSPQIAAAIPTEDYARIENGIRQLVRHGVSFYLEHQIQRSNGDIRIVQQQAEIFLRKGDRVRRIVGTIRDITTEKQTEEHIRRLAFYDSLTGLPNRRMFQERLTNALALASRKGAQVAILFLDLDRFKRINDTLGHAVGDAFLLETATRLKSLVRRSNVVASLNTEREEDLIARLGGDEFTIMFSDFRNTLNLAKVAQRILNTIKTPVTIDGQEVFSSVSIGIALFPDDGTDLDTLLKNADTAMFHAKSLGRGRYQYYSNEMNASSLAKLALETELRQAIDRNEFVLYFQPKLDMTSNRIVSVEALVRWQHPRRGLVYPGEFIALAEETGMIMDLGGIVIEQACLQFSQWRKSGIELASIAVNLSPVQFRRDDLVEHITATLEKTGVAPGNLELEITEGAVMHSEEAAIKHMQRLKTLGIRLTMDDFGIGYSSLSFLTRFPIDHLKIDRSFVSDLPQNQEKAAVVRAIIAMARSLNLTTIAEGVETSAQAQFLRSTGCDQIQGFLFSPAVPAPNLARLIELTNTPTASSQRYASEI